MLDNLLALVPPILAIALALWKREVMLALLGALLSAELIISAQHWWLAPMAAVERVVSVFDDPGNTRILLFSLLIGALIALIKQSGGVSAFVLWLDKKGLANSPRKAAWLCIGVSILLFIESTLSIFTSALVSTGLFDKYKMSRARLAYFIDSTCPTVKTLLPLNAWGALLLGLLAPFAFLNPVDVLIRSIPLNFYSLITLLFVFHMASTGRVFGSMKASESRVMIATQDTAPATHAAFFILPILILIVVMLTSMWLTGDGDILKGSSSKSVLWSVVFALFVAALQQRFLLGNKTATLLSTGFHGMAGLLSMVCLVLLAIGLGSALKQLGTAAVITALVGDFLPVWMLAPMIFLAGCFISFATGTSWGTFAIMMPIAMPFSATFNVPPELVLAAVIGGGVFGDHCSGISDTAILSSLAAGCDHYEHVSTQLPYALLAAVLTLFSYAVYGFIVL